MFFKFLAQNLENREFFIFFLSFSHQFFLERIYDILLGNTDLWTSTVKKVGADNEGLMKYRNYW